MEETNRKYIDSCRVHCPPDGLNNNRMTENIITHILNLVTQTASDPIFWWQVHNDASNVTRHVPVASHWRDLGWYLRGGWEICFVNVILDHKDLRNNLSGMWLYHRYRHPP